MPWARIVLVAYCRKREHDISRRWKSGLEGTMNLTTVVRVVYFQIPSPADVLLECIVSAYYFFFPANSD